MVCAYCNAYIEPDWVEVIPPSGTGYPTPISHHHTVGACSRCMAMSEETSRQRRVQREASERALREEVSRTLESEIELPTLVALLRKLAADEHEQKWSQLKGLWRSSAVAIWRKVREAGVLGQPLVQVVSVKFYKPRIGWPRVREQWRHGAWGTGSSWRH